MKLENWSLTHTQDAYKAPENAKPQLAGDVYGNEHFKDGTFVVTSRIVSAKDGIVKTYSGSEYELGEVHQEYETKYPDARNRLFNN